MIATLWWIKMNIYCSCRYSGQVTQVYLLTDWLTHVPATCGIRFIRWWRGLAVARWFRSTYRYSTPSPVSTWMEWPSVAGKPSRYVTSHLGQLSLPSLLHWLGLRRGMFACAGWQVILHPIWQATPRSSEMGFHKELFTASIFLTVASICGEDWGPKLLFDPPFLLRLSSPPLPIPPLRNRAP